MPACEACAVTAQFVEAGFVLVHDGDGQRYAIRGELTYPIPAECTEHVSTDHERTEKAA